MIQTIPTISSVHDETAAGLTRTGVARALRIIERTRPDLVAAVEGYRRMLVTGEASGDLTPLIRAVKGVVRNSPETFEDVRTDQPQAEEQTDDRRERGKAANMKKSTASRRRSTTATASFQRQSCPSGCSDGDEVQSWRRPSVSGTGYRRNGRDPAAETRTRREIPDAIRQSHRASAEEEQEMTTKQRKPRAKSPSKVGKGAAPHKAPKKNYFSTLMETPEGRELRRQWSTKPRKNGGRPKGVPDGYRKADIDPIRAEAKRKADKAVKIMAKEHNIEDDYAQEALRTAVEVMQVPGETRERLAAARLVLDFTKSRPASKQEVTIRQGRRVSGFAADRRRRRRTRWTNGSEGS